MKADSSRQTAILATISAIPAGRLSTYGEIARAAGYPGNARLVGHILKNLPKDSSIPWFRVINALGKISFPNGSQEHERQLALLMNEGHSSNLGSAYLKRHMWPTKM